MVKKNDGIKESTDSTNTIEEDGGLRFTNHRSLNTRKPVFGHFRPGPTKTGLYSHRKLLQA